MTDVANAKPLPMLRQLANAAPAIGFLIVLLVTHSFPTATWALVILSLLALALSLVTERRIAPIPAFSGGAALVFGGLSLVLHRADLLQMKMSIVDGTLGAVLLAGLALRRNLLKLLLGGAIALPDQAWRVLTIRYALFFWASAVANEIIRRTQTPEVWATFRVAAIGAAVLFGAAQFPLLKKYWVEPGPAEAPEPPEPGF
ncbi:MAG TPA: septation protein IspZ [Caulobacteraceae bacterium]|nr:septation protein IspZ [Caulobacteraceae bacterium]